MKVRGAAAPPTPPEGFDSLRPAAYPLALLFVSFSKQKPPAEPVETKSLDKRNPPLL